MDTALEVLASTSFLEKAYLLVVGAALTGIIVPVVTAETETEKRLTFTVEPGQERYVRLKIQVGIMVGRIVPELVDKVEAEKELVELNFIAEPLK